MVICKLLSIKKMLILYITVPYEGNDGYLWLWTSEKVKNVAEEKVDSWLYTVGRQRVIERNKLMLCLLQRCQRVAAKDKLYLIFSHRGQECLHWAAILNLRDISQGNYTWEWLQSSMLSSFLTWNLWNSYSRIVNLTFYCMKFAVNKNVSDVFTVSFL